MSTLGTFGYRKDSKAVTSVASDEVHRSYISDFRAKIKAGVSGAIDHSFLSGVVDALAHTEAIDDRKLLLEHVLTLLSRMPNGAISQKLQTATVELLYNDLPHPAATKIGNQFAWRTADGSYNNIDVPDMGASGTPYSRSVQQTHAIPANTLPDPGLVFDTLLRREGFTPHPAGLSSLMFSFAALVIHSVFRTSRTDVNINETSSYVDLSPLYGNNQADQDKVRIKDGRGCLKPDVFAEDRLLFLPPAVCVILTCFSRNHNYIANMLLKINERGKFVDPSTLSASDPKQQKQLADQDEELFQIARLCNAAWFASVVFSDYFSCILGLIRDGNSWSLNPFGEVRKDDHSLFERGQGNVCSVEFNCLYRWHATTSQEDEKWIETIFSQLFKGKNPDDISVRDFQTVAAQMEATEPDVSHWTFGGLQRGEDGYFKDADLANVLKNSTEHAAGAFRARGTPSVMRLHEVMGIEQNRRWGVCSLNDFRRFLGLKAYGSFKEWNPNPEIYEAAEKLYGDIERLELYVGLQAEEAKPVVEGAGLCPGYTISRAILSDAIALTRGDRFYTQDYTPFNMTAWGFADCQRDPGGAGFGSTLGRLFLRTLGHDYTHNSAYTWFPLMTPVAMKPHLTKLGVVEKYDMNRPTTKAPTVVLKDHSAVASVLGNPLSFETPYAERAAKVIKGNGFFLASSDAARGKREQREVLGALSGTPEGANSIAAFFSNKTKELIKSASYTQVGGKTRACDIVRDVLKYVPIYWVATEVAGITLKTPGTPHGLYTPQELYDKLGDIYSFIFLDVPASKVMVLEDKVKADVQELLGHIKNGLSGGGSRLSIFSLMELFAYKPKNDRTDLLTRLNELGYNSDQLANALLAVMVGFSVELSLSLTNTVNMYLGSEQETQLRSLSVGAVNPGIVPPALNTFIVEAIRLDPAFQGVYRVSTKDQTIGSTSIKKGERVFVDIGNANLNNLKVEQYLNGDVTRQCLGEAMTLRVISEVVRAVYSFPNLQRGPGRSGQLIRFKDDSQPSISHSYLDATSFSCPWPTTLIIKYDVV